MLTKKSKYIYERGMEQKVSMPKHSKQTAEPAPYSLPH